MFGLGRWRLLQTGCMAVLICTMGSLTLPVQAADSVQDKPVAKGRLHQPGYQPLFSDAVLREADPAARSRLQALEERNYQRWLAGQDGGPSRTTSDSASIGAGAAAQSGSGRLYRYTDAQGNVQFTDRRIKGASEVSVTVAEPTAASRAEHAARLQEQAQVLEAIADKKAHEQRAQAQERRQLEEQAARQSQCKQLFLDIQDNRRGGFVTYDLGPDGERVYLSDAELRARTDKMEQTYQRSCGPLPAIAR